MKWLILASVLLVGACGRYVPTETVYYGSTAYVYPAGVLCFPMNTYPLFKKHQGSFH